MASYGATALGGDGIGHRPLRLRDLHQALWIVTRRLGPALRESELAKWRIRREPWVQITAAVVELQSAIEDGDDATASEVVQLLPEMRHNTGALGEKLELLNRPSDADRYR